MRHREKTGTKGNDFLQLLMEVRDGQLKKDDKNELNDFEKDAALKNVDTEKVLFDDDAIIAQLLLFFLAGFDTTKSLISFALYELAINPDVQEKLLEEIKNAESGEDGKFSYDAIMNMEYLDKVINGEFSNKIGPF